MRKKEGPPESRKDMGRLECRWLGMGLLGYYRVLREERRPFLRVGKTREREMG